MEDKSFGQRLREERQARHLTLSDIARQVGISVPYLSDVERGKRGVFKADLMSKVAKALGMDDEELTAMAGKCPRCGK